MRIDDQIVGIRMSGLVLGCEGDFEKEVLLQPKKYGDVPTPRTPSYSSRDTRISGRDSVSKWSSGTGIYPYPPVVPSMSQVPVGFTDCVRTRVVSYAPTPPHTHVYSSVKPLLTYTYPHTHTTHPHTSPVRISCFSHMHTYMPHSFTPL